LREVSISQMPEYNALSYVWHGQPQVVDSENRDANATRTVFIDNFDVQVSANLADFIDTITQLWTPVPLL
jgi:hypothetical protein